MERPQEIFLSHSSGDHRFATRVADALRHHGISVWYSRTDLVGSQEWHDEIGAALKRCDWFLLVLSPTAIESMWVKRELNYARRQARFVGKIVPLLYQSCESESLSWVLGSIHRIDFQSTFAEGCRELLRVWDVDYQS